MIPFWAVRWLSYRVLIIVMAILTMLMAAIMQMFKPIRETYVDATLYENQRTVQNGVIQYISESVRYNYLF